MAQTINNSASTIYNFDGGSSSTATSNVLPINFETSNGLDLTKTSNKDTFSVGDIITYTVTITNNSSLYMTGVRIIDDLGGGYLAYVLSSATLTVGSLTYPVTPIATNPLTFVLQQLPIGSTMTLSYKCQVVFNLPNTVSIITNSVQGIGYTSSGTIMGYANDSISRQTDPDFSISKSSSVSNVVPNQTFNYYITLTNDTDTISNITSITDTLPTNYTLSSVSLNIGGGPSTVLSSSDYVLTSSNILTVPSSTGPSISVPANSSTILTLTGFLS